MDSNRNESAESAQELVNKLARELVDRVFAVYNAEYIERCLREEPKSMLALAGRLREALTK